MLRARAALAPAALLLVAGLALSGCGATDVPAAAGAQPTSASPSPTAETGYRVVAPATIEPGDPVPAPAGKVVLTLGGRISQHNAGDRLAFDLATLERLGTVEYAVDDHQAEGRTVTFRGVLLRDLLAVAGAERGSSTLHSVALNDYAVDIPVQDATDLPVLVATAADGAPMTVDHYGPVRVIYPTSTHTLDPTVYDPRWIWQLATVEVR